MSKEVDSFMKTIAFCTSTPPSKTTCYMCRSGKWCVLWQSIARTLSSFQLYGRKRPLTMGDMLSSVVAIKHLLITAANDPNLTDRIFDKDHRLIGQSGPKCSN